VPGGAGYVERIRHELLDILRAAHNRTRNCRNQTCDSRGSCYACLRQPISMGSTKSRISRRLARGDLGTWFCS
jgi:hypothetical protein